MQELQFPVGLGDRVRDSVTGFTGIVVALTEWFNACQRATVQPPVEEGKPGMPTAEAFDVEQLEVIEAGAVPRKNRAVREEPGAAKPGGPMPGVSEHRVPAR